MDVRADMLVFQGFKGPDRSFGPGMSAQIWEFGEGVDSARGVAVIAPFCRTCPCNSACDVNSSQWLNNDCIRSAVLRVEQFVCNSSCEGAFQKCFNGRRILSSAGAGGNVLAL